MNVVKRRLPWATWTICAAAMLAVAGLLIIFSPSLLVAFSPGRVFKSYYIPSESMRPTLEINDRIIPLELTSQNISRGTIIMFESENGVRIARAVGLAEDVIEMRDGLPIINGKPVQQRPIGLGPTLKDGTDTRLIAERLPSEDHWHSVLDAGTSEGDTTRPVRVPARSLFVLGDNRDFAADSRYSTTQSGVGMVFVTAVIGSVDTLYWSKDRSRIGVPIDRPVSARGVAP